MGPRVRFIVVVWNVVESEVREACFMLFLARASYIDKEYLRNQGFLNCWEIRSVSVDFID